MEKSKKTHNIDALLEFDRKHIWHPYTSMNSPLPAFLAKEAKGTRIVLADGRELIDGMASWWAVIHGYNHPCLNAAIETQLSKMAHVMFGGLTHEGAVLLAQKLISITPDSLQHIFFCDSGSVAVEVAMKMAVQFWAAQKINRRRFVTVRSGYHGDTHGAMSVCDPVNGMHSLFQGAIVSQYFAPAPPSGFSNPFSPNDITPLAELVTQHKDDIAGIILEPIVQGAGGMRFYSPVYLAAVRDLCDEFGILLLADEIATGFGRTGKLFACEHAAIEPDICCLGKAITGGYMSFAATLTTARVAQTISSGTPSELMHGPTFMANPLACAVSLASIDLLLESDWQKNIARIESGLWQGLLPCADFSGVADVRVLGAIGVVEMRFAVDVAALQAFFVECGVWVRPFGRLIYVMPPYCISDSELALLCSAIVSAVRERIGEQK